MLKVYKYLEFPLREVVLVVSPECRCDHSSIHERNKWIRISRSTQEISRLGHGILIKIKKYSDQSRYRHWKCNGNATKWTKPNHIALQYASSICSTSLPSKGILFAFEFRSMVSCWSHHQRVLLLPVLTHIHQNRMQFKPVFPRTGSLPDSYLCAHPERNKPKIIVKSHQTGRL